jgi:uncharacterized protein YktA (UPF0223 family)
LVITFGYFNPRYEKSKAPKRIKKLYKEFAEIIFNAAMEKNISNTIKWDEKSKSL